MQYNFRPLKVFLSYSHQDMQVKAELARSLAIETDFEILSDDQLPAGADWNKALTSMRNEAEVFLLLVSKAYMASKMINTVELPQILKRAGKDSVYIIPVILERCDWQGQPYGTYQALPKFGEPVAELEDKTEGFSQIIEALASIASLKHNAKIPQIIAREKEVKSGILVISDCNLESIPRDLLEMTWLKELNLSRNNITKIENLDNLADLQHLNLAENQIEDIKGLETLKNLVFLDLESNMLSEIENLEENINLKVLGLSSNLLENLSGISHLKNLETLYAGHNELIGVEELAEMPQLNRIILTNNHLQSIKPLLPRIKSGLKVALGYSYDPLEPGIFIKENKSLAEPPIEVVEKGSAAILKYFRDAEMFGTEKLEIVKLILVGNSKVGKSNFSEFLRDLPITESHNSTHLLDIQSWDATFLKSVSGKPMRVNIFDFGGQDYYHDSHRMYYSHDTAYVLLWDTETNKYSEEVEDANDPEDSLIYENFPLEYWLESINYNLTDKYRHSYNPEKRDQANIKKPGNTSPVLVLQNKIDKGEGRLDQQALSLKYENISGFFNLSLKTKRRTNVLFEVLSDYMNALNLSGRQLIAYEHKIVESYLTEVRQFKVISLDDFHKECVEIIDNTNISFNKENAQIIAEILNSIGIIFYDKLSEKDGLIFTRINRLNEIIKEIMDIAKKGNDKGIFRKSQIDHIEHREEVLELLVKNNSIIRINKTDFLVPQFLPLKPDPSIEFFLNAFTFNQVRFIYKAYFHKTLLLSLFSRYLSKTVSDTTTNIKGLPFWRNGIIIEGINRQKVFVEFLKVDTMGIINIRTMATYNKKGLEREIENTLDELNKGWSVDKEISVNSTDFFDVKYLHKEVKDLHFEFSANGKVFSVNDFKQLIDFEKLPKKLFISYSSKNSEFIKRFVTHLEILKSSGLIDPWYDRMIESGTKWDDTIAAEMRNSDVIIFLLSPDFLATEYIMKTEVPMAIEQLKNEVSKFFFIELQPCGWKRTDIGKYQQTFDEGKAQKNIITIGTPDNDEMWNQVINELVRNKLKKKMSW